MAETMRAKFNVSSITHYGNAGGREVTLSPVMANNDENKKFWENTPSGTIKLMLSNEDAKFEFGEYYVDFTKADS